MRITVELQEQLAKIALREKRATTEVARIILEAAIPVVLRGRESLTDFSAAIGQGDSIVRSEPTYSRRVSHATQDQVQTALRMIFQNAPMSVIERVVEFISERAARYDEASRD